MRILFTWHAAVEPEYRKLFKEIVKKGYELTVICPKAWTEGGRLQRIDNSDEACSERNKSNEYSLFSFPVIFRNRIKGFFYPQINSLCRLFCKFKPDIVHIFEEPYSLACFQMVASAKIVSPPSKIIVQSFENMIIPQNFPFSFIERFVLNNTNLLISIPKEGESVWRGKGYSGTIKQLPVGLDETLFKKTEGFLPDYPFLNKRDKVRIGYVGRLSYEKGLSLLLEAVSNLLKRTSDFELLIIGNGERKRFESLASELGIKEKIVFIDAVPNYQLPIIYSKIDVLVLPSLTTDRWKEQFGRVLIEAMACGTVVVGSSSGEIPDIIGEAGFIFEEGNISALSKILEELVSDSNLREKLGKMGRNRVLQNFTWSSITERLYSIYKDIK
ncbi:MAG: glycosyltransferase family 4 protein [Nitrospinae bacterium]|nr:glycosyltransferase family 4 protein [Nitrospinota bacterium]